MPRREALHRPRQLTELMVDKLKPPTERQYDNYYDTIVPRLVLRVNRGGTKAWHVLFYENGKPRTHQLNRYPYLKVREAREQARLFLGNPQKALAQVDAGSFADVAANWIKRHVDGNPNADPPRPPLRSKPEIVRCLKKYVLPRWSAKPFAEITRRDVINLLDEIEDNNGPVQADQVLAHISSICAWYQSRNDDYVSPIVKGMKRSKQSDRARARVLDDPELRAVWKAASACGIFGALVQVLLLTGQRLGKVSGMQHEDVADGVWTIRTEKREKGNAGSLRLPPLALDIINALPRVAGNPHVFVGGRSGKPLSSFTDGKAALDRAVREARAKDKLADLPRWTLHDLRRTARTLMERADVRPDIGERVLGHRISGVEGTYRRWRYDDEKADALVKLAALIERVVNPPPPNVVALAGKRKKR